MDRTPLGDRWAFGRPYQPFATPRKRRWSGISMLTALMLLVGGAVALADQAEGDIAGPDTTTKSVTAGAAFNFTADLFLQRQGTASTGVTWAGPTKTASSTGACDLITGTLNPSGFSLGSGWTAEPNGTLSFDFDSSAKSTVTISGTAGAAGASCILTYTGTSTGNQPGQTGQSLPPGQRTVAITVSFVGASNSAPVIDRDNASVTVNEGATATNTGTWSDANAGDTVTLSASVGSVTKGGTNAAGTWSWSFGTSDGPDDSQIVTITADDGTTTASTTFALVVNNVKPTPSIDSLTGAGGVACIGGNMVTLGFSWTDPAGANDTYDYSVNWGDGSTTPTSGTTAATSPVTGLQHTYAAGGPYTIQVTVNDSDTGAGTTVSSSQFSFLYNVTGVLQPVNDTQAHQDPSIFKWGSTIPVKIRVTDCNGTSVSGLSPTITVSKVNPNPPPDGDAETTQSTSAADTGNTMRYDASAGQYIYNLATKPLTDGTATYTIKITGPFSTVYANFGLKTK